MNAITEATAVCTDSQYADTIRSAPSVRVSGVNDAFSFWKLPEPWRPALEATLAASRIITEWYLLERYRPRTSQLRQLALTIYYALKNVLPKDVRHLLNSAIVGLRRTRDFPRWPCEDALLVFWREWLRHSLETVGATDGWHIGFWPENKDSCIVLTHDVESPAGFDRMEALAELEMRYGFRSAWNLPLDQYLIDWNRVEELRARGFEFGAHGLRHDGMLFRSHKHFLALKPRLEALAHEHRLAGFRSPSTHRTAEWMGSLDFDFDCSFADTDPYEPQPGGTGSIFPFFLGSLVELPYTMPQDHTLINLLRCAPLPIWIRKMNWLAAQGGMILTIVHPDYCGSGSGLRAYDELLKRLSDLESSWRALPSQVTAWWQSRDKLELQLCGDRPIIHGPNSFNAVARRLSSQRMLHGD